HIFMVFTVDPYALQGMTVGGYDERKSPEARNARPLYHLLPRTAPPEESDLPTATIEVRAVAAQPPPSPPPPPAPQGTPEVKP
ncbi:MAG: hypothetical protein ABI875_09625, partial [Gemmatimonadales bacterium]